jgi:biofilm PGA synthesis N-glycosyltransferase PgaC
MPPRVLVISPVRNEAAHIERVIRAMAAQESPPDRWIVLDDDSTDDTLSLLQELSPEVPFMRVLSGRRAAQNSVGTDRLAQALDAQAFNQARATVDWREYTHIMKLDGDIELPPSYLRVLLERFDANPELGIAGGVLDEPTPDGGARRVKIAPYHVHGAVKCYTRDCFAAIGGVQERLAWDTIDETYARMHGYATASFSELVSVHHRPCATADGVLRGRARHGECAYISHYPPVWVTLRAFKVASSRPRGVSGGAFLFGYARAAVRGTERVPDTAYRSFTRRELRRRMANALIPRRSTPFPGG